MSREIQGKAEGWLQSRPGNVTPRRPRIAFFDYFDVFEDFFPHYGVDQHTFATRWADTGIHAYLTLLQRNIGDVVWYAFSLNPELETAHHETVGCTVRFFRTSWLHRSLWWLFYMPRFAWRWERAYPAYAVVASYLSLLSWSFLRGFFRDRPDFIFVQDYASGRFDTLILLARALGIPLIAFHTGPLPSEYVGKLAKRWTIRRADKLVVYSRKESKMLTRRYHVSLERVKVILPPLDTQTFRPMNRLEACRAAGLDSTRRYLLFVGRLDDAVKRVSALIHAFASEAYKHPDVDFLIAGSGPDEEELHETARDILPSRIRFLGWITPEQKPGLYNVAECLLLASRSEGFPTVIGEAMLCGTPVLASDVGAISELVADSKTGWLFEAGDDSGLVRALTEVLEHPARTAAMRPYVRRVAEDRLSPRLVAPALRECFPWERSHERS